MCVSPDVKCSLVYLQIVSISSITSLGFKWMNQLTCIRSTPHRWWIGSVSWKSFKGCTSVSGRKELPLEGSIVYWLTFEGSGELLKIKCEEGKIEHFINERTYSPITLKFWVDMWCFLINVFLLPLCLKLS